MNLNLPIPSMTIDYLRNQSLRLKQILTLLNNQSKRQVGTSAPTTGLWSQGDFVWNTSPAELGSASSKYVIIGWSCVAGGEPGTWKEARALTGA